MPGEFDELNASNKQLYENLGAESKVFVSIRYGRILVSTSVFPSSPESGRGSNGFNLRKPFEWTPDSIGGIERLERFEQPVPDRRLVYNKLREQSKGVILALA